MNGQDVPLQIALRRLEGITGLVGNLCTSVCWGLMMCLFSTSFFAHLHTGLSVPVSEPCSFQLEFLPSPSQKPNGSWSISLFPTTGWFVHFWYTFRSRVGIYKDCNVTHSCQHFGCIFILLLRQLIHLVLVLINWLGLTLAFLKLILWLYVISPYTVFLPLVFQKHVVPSIFHKDKIYTARSDWAVLSRLSDSSISYSVKFSFSLSLVTEQSLPALWMMNASLFYITVSVLLKPLQAQCCFTSQPPDTSHSSLICPTRHFPVFPPVSFPLTLRLASLDHFH